jgi:hypothetical protein
MKIKLFLPPVIVLIVTISISIFDIGFSFFFGLNIVWFVLFRMVRLSALFILAVYLIKPISSLIGRYVNRNHRIFFHLKSSSEIIRKDLFQLWFVRPMQGIGISMLLASKLIYLLHIYYNLDKSFQLITPIAFNWQRFVQTTLIIIPISIILSVFWMLSDLSIRYFNKKSNEVKILGNAMALIIPMLFGFYGLSELIEDNTGFVALYYLIQITIALYPPFAFYTVFHNLYISKNRIDILKRLGSRKAGIDVTWKR